MSDNSSGKANKKRGVFRLSRRRFMQSSIAVAATSGIPFSLYSNSLAAIPLNQQASFHYAQVHPITLNINGRIYKLMLEPRVTLLDALREYIGMTGTKKGCDRGQCGACTVLVSGRRINSCLSLAVAHAEDEIVTVEGLARAGKLHAVQAAFVEQDAFQCGYCTPGQICSAVAMLAEAAAGAPSAVTPDVRKLGTATLSDDEVRERMSGNICRCGAYPNIVAAVKKAGGVA